MNKGFILSTAALMLAGMLVGCNRSSEIAPAAKPAAVAMSYPAPEVEVDAQPMLASYDGQVDSDSQNGFTAFGDPIKPKKRSHKHSHHKKVEKDASADADMGYMAADDPKLLEAEIAKKEKAQDTNWKDWVAPQDQGPEGH